MGIRTNLAFHQNLIAHPEFAAGRYHTGFIAEHTAALCGYAPVPAEDEATLAAAIAVTASRAEQRDAHAATGRDGGDRGGAPRVSPWVLHHRAFR
jgi:acetyl-CoA carboxylase biotin carboxylase subunit